MVERLDKRVVKRDYEVGEELINVFIVGWDGNGEKLKKCGEDEVIRDRLIEVSLIKFLRVNEVV